jgi:hypothetical protein
LIAPFSWKEKWLVEYAAMLICHCRAEHPLLLFILVLVVLPQDWPDLVPTRAVSVRRAARAVMASAMVCVSEFCGPVYSDFNSFYKFIAETWPTIAGNR